MSTLFEIAENMQALEELIDQHLTQTEGEITPEVEAIIDEWLLANEQELTKKLEGYVSVMREHEAQGKLIDARAKAFKAMYEDEKKLAATRANRATALKKRLQWFYELRGIDSLQAGPYKIALQKNGGAQPLVVDTEVDPDKVPDMFIKREIDTAAVRAHLEAGGTLEWARLAERGSSIRIK